MKPIFVLAMGSWREFSRDRIFYLTLFAAALLVGFSHLLAELTIVESRKILLDFGFAFLSLSGIGIALFLGVVVMAKEIDSRTIYAVISKPVSRESYICGKFLGTAAVLAMSNVLLSCCLALMVKLAGEELPAGFWPCCGLIFLESLLLLAFALLASIPFSSVIAAGLSFSFFLVGRSSYALSAIAEKDGSSLEIFFFRFLYYVFPNLERFNLRDVVAYGQPYPPEMILRGAVYCAAYVAVFIGLAVILFRKRDIP